MDINLYPVSKDFTILVYIHRDATLPSSFYLETALHVSIGTSTHHQKRIQLYLQHLVFVTTLLLSAAILEDSYTRAAPKLTL